MEGKFADDEDGFPRNIYPFQKKMEEISKNCKLMMFDVRYLSDLKCGG